VVQEENHTKVAKEMSKEAIFAMSETPVLDHKFRQESSSLEHV